MKKQEVCITGKWRFAALFAVIILSFSVESIAQDRDIYQIKIYTIESEKQEQRIDNYLKNAYMPALHKAGIKSVGVFKNIKDSNTQENMIYVFIPFKSIDQFEQIESLLAKDKGYQSAGADYIDAAHDNAPYERISSILLRAFKTMPHFGIPNHSTPPSERVYELRSYEGATEKLYEKKVEMFTDGGETKIFADLGFEPVFYGEVISGPSMPNLMYMTTFENEVSQSKHWDAFRTAPAWLKLKADQQYNNTVSKNTKYFLRPTEYSDL